MAKNEEAQDPRDVFKPADLQRFEVLTKQLYEADTTIKALEKSKKTGKDQMLELLAEYGVSKLQSDLGTVSLSATSIRRSLDKELVLQVFAEYGVPAEKLDECMKETRVPGSLRCRWGG